MKSWVKQAQKQIVEPTVLDENLQQNPKGKKQPDYSSSSFNPEQYDGGTLHSNGFPAVWSHRVQDATTSGSGDRAQAEICLAIKISTDWSGHEEGGIRYTATKIQPDVGRQPVNSGQAEGGQLRSSERTEYEFATNKTRPRRPLCLLEVTATACTDS